VTSGLSFTDCEIPEENLLPGVFRLEGAAELPEPGALWNRMGRAGSGDGMLRHGAAIRQNAASNLRNKPIASHQLVQEKLAWMITEIVKGQLLALHVGRLKDNGKVDPSHISMLKMNNVAMRWKRPARRANILGANGIVDDLLHHAAHEQSRERVYLRRDERHHKLVIGERITGIAALCRALRDS